MTYLSLPAPTTNIADATLATGQDISAWSGTSIASNSGVQVHWCPNMMLLVKGATGNSVTLTWVHTGTSAPADVTTGNLSAAHFIAFGPIPGMWANASGIVTINITGTVSGMAFGAFFAPAWVSPTGPMHSPLESTVGALDY